MEVNHSIFRSYDIRGVYPDSLDESVSLNIGKALGTIIKRRGFNDIVVGRDNRNSSYSLMESFLEGLVSTGCDITDVGISVTPVIHYLTCVEEFDCGVEVTASHNPKEFNGFRIDYHNAVPFYGDDITKIKNLVLSEDFDTGSGNIVKRDLFPKYLDFLKSRFKYKNNYKVVLDCGNGTSSYFAPKIFQEIGCEVYTMYCEPDGDYPHGTPDPENRLFMSELEKKVREGKCDLGFAFDTDMDRLGVVDENGFSYNTDKLLLFFAEDLLKEKKDAIVIYDIKCSSVVGDLVKMWGGKPVMMQTGHPFFVDQINKGASLGGEFSGHIFFGEEYYGYDDGIYAACKLIEILDESNEKSFAVKMKDYPTRFHSSEIKITCPEELKFSLIDTIIKNIRDTNDALDINETDGVRVSVTETGWFLIRASNTTPMISVRIEGKDEKEAKMMTERVINLLNPFDFLDLKELHDVDIYES